MTWPGAVSAIMESTNGKENLSICGTKPRQRPAAGPTQIVNKVQMLNAVGDQPKRLIVLIDSLLFLKQGGLFS